MADSHDADQHAERTIAPTAHQAIGVTGHRFSSGEDLRLASSLPNVTSPILDRLPARRCNSDEEEDSEDETADIASSAVAARAARPATMVQPRSSVRGQQRWQRIRHTIAPLAPSASASQRYRQQPHGWAHPSPNLLAPIEMPAWPASLTEPVTIVLDDGTLRRRRMTRGSFSVSEDGDGSESLTRTVPLARRIETGTDASVDSETELLSSLASPSPPPPPPRYPPWSLRLPVLLTVQQQRTLKAALAYGIACMATFWSVPFELIGGKSTHLAALSMFFFNPARTRGALLESVLLGLLGMAYGCIVVVAVVSAVVLLNHLAYYTASKWVAVLGVGGLGTLGVAAAKAWLKRPAVYTAGSVASLTMYVALTRIIADEPHVREIDWDGLIGPQKAFLVGIFISLMVNWLLWPQRACQDLKHDVTMTLASFDGLLKLIIKIFLLDTEAPVEALPMALASHRQSFTSLRRSMHEARLEPADQLWPRLPEYGALIESLNQLTQHVSGLSSCVGVQREMIAQQRIRRAVKAMQRRRRHPGQFTSSSGYHYSSAKGDKAEETEEEEEEEDEEDEEEEGGGELRAFLTGIGPVMHALSYTCRRTLRHMQRAVDEDGRGAAITVDTGRLRSNLDLAVRNFDRETSVSLRRLYKLLYRRRLWRQVKHDSVRRRHRHDHPLEQPTADDKEKAATPTDSSNNSSSNDPLSPLPSNDTTIGIADDTGGSLSQEVFPVYFFLFSLKRFACQLSQVVDRVEQLQAAHQRGFWTAFRSQLYLIWLTVIGVFGFGAAAARGMTALDDNAEAPTVWHRFDPKSVHNTLHSPPPRTWLQRTGFGLVQLGDFLKRFQTRYAIKSAFFAMLLIAPAFLDDWRITYQNYRGEWAVISMAVVMTPTVGGSNVVALYRLIGTMLGSAIAYLAYTMFPGSRVMLPIIAFLFALPCFHLVMHTGYPRVGQFTCMTFTTVLMSQYAVLEDDELEIRDIALTRAVTVGLGVLVGLFATLYVWPYEARVALRAGLSDFFLNLILLYHKMVALYSKSWLEDQQVAAMADCDGTVRLSLEEPLPEAELIRRSTQEFLSLELLLQLKLLKLQDLLMLTRNEPRLKGPFPTDTYATLIGHCQAMIDRMLTMRMAVTDADWLRSVRHDFIRPVQAERRQLCGAVEMYMYSAAAALLLKLPVPAYLPPVTEAWRALMSRVRRLPGLQRSATAGSEGELATTATATADDDSHRREQRFMLYFAYVLAMGDVARELEGVGTCLRSLYGVIGGSQAQFDNCFES